MLAARHRARLSMEERIVDLQEIVGFRNARRRLFQGDDEDTTEKRQGVITGVEDNVANCFFEEVLNNRKDAMKKWNFDFEKEQPLPGRYQWVKVNKADLNVHPALKCNDRFDEKEEEEVEEPEEVKEKEDAESAVQRETHESCCRLTET